MNEHVEVLRSLRDDFADSAPREQTDALTAAIALMGGQGEAVALWCLHIEGPDEVHAAPSREHAQMAADIFNATIPRVDGGSSLCLRAVVAPWPHSAASHADDVGRFIAEWLIPRAHLEVLTAAPPREASEAGQGVEYGGRVADCGCGPVHRSTCMYLATHTQEGRG